jgi:hypothetical protein
MNQLSWKSVVKELRGTAAVMSAVLATFASAVLIEHLAGLSPGIVVVAVVLALTLSRVQRRHADHWLVAVLVPPAIAVAASEVGVLMFRHPNVGDTLFVLALSGAIWIRRFGPAYSRAGTLATLPFIAILITPVPAVAIGHTNRLWFAAMALIAAGWVTLAKEFSSKLWSSTDRAPAILPPARNLQAPANSGRRRMAVSTRMALQLAVALSAAMVVGHLLFPDHWSWLVVSAYIVSSGNRGRGDVVYKGLLRVAGAAVGTVVATVIAGQFEPGDRTAVVLIFVVLTVGTLVRRLSYAYWAACITAVLALLYGYFGEPTTSALPGRVGAIAIGALLAAAAAWFVFPVRTVDVARRRMGGVLGALRDYVAAARESTNRLDSEQHRVDATIEELEQIAGPIRLHRRLPARLRGRKAHPDDALRAILRCRTATREITAGRANGAMTEENARLRHLGREIATARDATIALRDNNS